MVLHWHHRDALGKASVILLIWSLLYALPHLYWGLGGTAGFFVYKPSATEIDYWEVAHLFAFAAILIGGLLGFALERAGEQPLLRLLLLVTVGVASAITASHGAYGILFRALSVTGVTDVEGVPFDIDRHGWVLWDMLAIEPWFLGMGILLGVTGYCAQRSHQGRVRWTWLVVFGFLAAFGTAALGLKFG